MLLERDKITFALELAIAEVTRKKKLAAAEDDDPDSSKAEIQTMKKTKKANFLGVSSVIKLPFVIGTPEYDRHDTAGIVFQGTEFDQKDHFMEE